MKKLLWLGLALVGACPAGDALLCGNGVLDAGEVCDDRNALDGDGCSAACVIEEGHLFEGVDPALGGVPATIVGTDAPVIIHGTINGDNTQDVFVLDTTLLVANMNLQIFDPTTPIGECNLNVEASAFSVPTETLLFDSPELGICAGLSFLVSGPTQITLTIGVSANSPEQTTYLLVLANSF